MAYVHRTFFAQSGGLENTGLRETKIDPAAIPAVRSFSRRSPQILAILSAQLSERELCRGVKWRRKRRWKPTLSAGRSENVGMIAENGAQARLRRFALKPARQRLGVPWPCLGRGPPQDDRSWFHGSGNCPALDRRHAGDSAPCTWQPRAAVSRPSPPPKPVSSQRRAPTPARGLSGATRSCCSNSSISAE